MTSTKKRTAIFISGRGSNMQALVAAAEGEDYPAQFELVLSNRPDAAGIAWAQARGLRTLVIDHKAYRSRTDFEAALQAALDANQIELIALAGFLRLLTPEFVTHWHGRMINIHPSLLPGFKGLNTHSRAIEAGVKIAGCTVHFVTPEMDGGPIIAQAAVRVLPDDSEDRLAARVLEAEHVLYPAALRLVASGATYLDGNKVHINHIVRKLDTLYSPSI